MSPRTVVLTLCFELPCRGSWTVPRPSSYENSAYPRRHHVLALILSCVSFHLSLSHTHQVVGLMSLPSDGRISDLSEICSIAL
jgi:hypothetical protein